MIHHLELKAVIKNLKEKENFCIYEGFWNKNKREGKGRLITPDFIYFGEWSNDTGTGNGVRIEVSSNIKTKGEFRNLLPHGQCTQSTKDGTNYSGMYENGKLSGKGSYRCSDGSTYEGDFKDGFKEGFGKLKDSSGNLYEGKFKNGLYHGAGKLQYTNGSTYNGGFIFGK